MFVLGYVSRVCFRIGFKVCFKVCSGYASNYVSRHVSAMFRVSVMGIWFMTEGTLWGYASGYASRFACEYSSRYVSGQTYVLTRTPFTPFLETAQQVKK